MYTLFWVYVFYSLSVGKSMLRFSKFSGRWLGDGIGKRLPVHITLLWTWFLTGFWHGPTWNFVAWGLANGVVIMVSLELVPLYERFHGRFTGAAESRIYRCWQIFRTFWLMNLVRSFDIYAGVRNTFGMMLSVITDFDLSGFLSRNISELTLPVSDYVGAGVGLLVLFWISYLGRGGVDFRDKLASLSWPARYAVVGVILLSCWLWALMAMVMICGSLFITSFRRHALHKRHKGVQNALEVSKRVYGGCRFHISIFYLAAASGS